MNNYPAKWGCIPDLRECLGKTIEAADLVEMPHGCTWYSAWIVRFSDGTRAFFAGAIGTGIMSPELSVVQKCPLFTPEEFAEMAGDFKRQRDRRADEEKERKLREFERLRIELGK